MQQQNFMLTVKSLHNPDQPREYRLTREDFQKIISRTNDLSTMIPVERELSFVSITFNMPTTVVDNILCSNISLPMNLVPPEPIKA